MILVQRISRTVFRISDEATILDYRGYSHSIHVPAAYGKEFRSFYVFSDLAEYLDPQYGDLFTGFSKVDPE